MLALVLISLSFSAWSISAEHIDCPLPCACNSTKLDVGEVEKYCKNHSATMIERCCVFNDTITGLDLRFCNAEKLNISESVFSDIEILDLTESDETKATTKEFVGLLKLNFLYLPEHVPCPGGKNAWNETAIGDRNITLCRYQLDPCSSLNISCGDYDDAACHHLGPGSAKCLCKPGYYGYKCLRYGEFPVTAFNTAVIVPTVVLSIVLWFVQGRDVHRTSN